MQVLDPMDKMWASFWGMGIMIFAAILITFGRMKTTGIVRFILSFVAFLLLLVGMLLGLIAII